MDILFTKISDQEHALTVRRQDGSTDSVVLNSRSFLRHDLSHLAVELELPLSRGFWGSVANGAALGADQFKGGSDLALAEALAGPVQTLLRTKADAEQFLSVLNRVCPTVASWDVAARIRERGRRLQGHWQATPYGDDMLIRWRVQSTQGIQGVQGVQSIQRDQRVQGIQEVNKARTSGLTAQTGTGHSPVRNLKPSFVAPGYGTR